jgi:hypothetical protein
MPQYHKTPDTISSLSPDQYRVTQHHGTERPFDNAYWDNKEPGIYVDVVSGEPLFASVNKFDSSSGWPSFQHREAPDEGDRSRRVNLDDDVVPRYVRLGPLHLDGDIGKRSTGLIRTGGTLVTIPGPPEARPADGLAVYFVVVPDRAQLSEVVWRVRDGHRRPAWPGWAMEFRGRIYSLPAKEFGR